MKKKEEHINTFFINCEFKADTYLIKSFLLTFSTNDNEIQFNSLFIIII